MKKVINVKIVEKLRREVFGGRALVRAAWGGRGSGKTRSFATMCVLRGFELGHAGVSGVILCARQFQNSLADSSLIELKRSIEVCPAFMEYYEVGEKYIKSRDGRIQFQFIGLQVNVSSVKSMGQILICWVDEAQNVTSNAWEVLIPTLRAEGKELGGWHSELWVTWNPLHKNCPVEGRFRFSDDPDVRKCEVHWSDNRAFPEVLNRRRERDLVDNPDRYGHIWDGEYATSVEGAYYSRQMLAARNEGRICELYMDPWSDLRAFWDLGGTGCRSDSTAIWVAQFIKQSVYVLDYYEAQGVELSVHMDWLRKHGYDRGMMVLPHDGATHDRVYNVSFESALIAAGFRVLVVPNQGSGAAKLRIEAARRLFPRIWFNEKSTVLGREALEWYHEKRIEGDGRFFGGRPEHDWSSHAADAFGMMCIVYEQTRGDFSGIRRAMRDSEVIVSDNSWMAV